MSINLDILETSVIEMEASKREWYIIAVHLFRYRPLSAYGFTSELEQKSRDITDPFALVPLNVTMMDIPNILQALGMNSADMMQDVYNSFKSKLSELEAGWLASTDELEIGKGEYLQGVRLGNQARKDAYQESMYNEAKTMLKLS